jgi:hypothetical protein
MWLICREGVRPQFAPPPSGLILAQGFYCVKQVSKSANLQVCKSANLQLANRRVSGRCRRGRAGWGKFALFGAVCYNTKGFNKESCARFER